MIDYIRKKLDDPELLCQLAEEASELAQAALKLRRAITGDNPTPVTPEQARANLLEEVVDVLNCLRTMKIPIDPAAYYQAMDAKAKRWSERLSKIPEPGPLTLEELRQMEGEPVWIVWPDNRIKSKWWIVGNYDWHMMEFSDPLTERRYGSVWIAYRHKPKEVQE